MAPTKPSAKDTSGHVINGTHKFKFFKRPIVPLLQAVPAEALLDEKNQSRSRPGTANPGGGVGTDSKVADTPQVFTTSRTVGTQTLFRESEIQTDPWTPEYKVKDGEPVPEAVAIAHLKFGEGLPASLDEIKLIR
mgnify:CR=1 FL=1